MTTRFLTNNENELLEAIRDNVSNADSFFATAFGSVEGFRLIKTLLKH